MVLDKYLSWSSIRGRVFFGFNVCVVLVGISWNFKIYFLIEYDRVYS